MGPKALASLICCVTTFDGIKLKFIPNFNGSMGNFMVILLIYHLNFMSSNLEHTNLYTFSFLKNFETSYQVVKFYLNSIFEFD